MTKFEQARKEYQDWRERHGVSVCDSIVKEFNRRRVERVNPKLRKRYSWSAYRSLYEQQRGVCPICQEKMFFIRGEIEMDHIDPNAVDFEARSNRRILCRPCNREKAALSIPEQAKKYGKTMEELLK